MLISWIINFIDYSEWKGTAPRRKAFIAGLIKTVMNNHRKFLLSIQETSKTTKHPKSKGHKLAKKYQN
jgi:hypothetical protein